MIESQIRRSADIIAFPSKRRIPAHTNATRALEVEAARLVSAIDTTGWYHEEAIEEESKDPRQGSSLNWRDRH